MPCGFRKNDLHLLSDIGSRTALALDEKILNKTIIGYDNNLKPIRTLTNRINVTKSVHLTTPNHS